MFVDRWETKSFDFLDVKEISTKKKVLYFPEKKTGGVTNAVTGWRWRAAKRK